MLGKLIKYEWKNTSRVCVITLLALIGITLMGVLYYMSPLWNGLLDSGYFDETALVPILSGVASLVLYILVVVGAEYGVFLFLLIRFYRSMYTEEGYLTHTLPVTQHQLLLSKILVSGGWYLLSEIAAMASLFVLLCVFFHGAFPEDMALSLGQWKTLFSMISRRSGIHLAGYAAVLAFVLLLGPFLGVCLYFCGITLGQLAKNHKGLMAIVGCIAVYLVNQIVLFVVQCVLLLGQVTAGVVGGKSVVGIMQPASYVVMLIVQAAMGVGAYFLTHYIVSRKLNLN